jgi:GrpB-like predicted nucleotidyltransferase (UPF0157 family)
MKILPFDEDLSHREILPYKPVYRDLFVAIRNYVEAAIPSTEVIHIGSTAIPDLRGKPMLDLVVVSRESDLRRTQRRLEVLGFHRRDVWVDRDDKPYVCGSVRHDDTTYNVNVHVCRPGDPVQADSLAFIEILNRRPDLRRRYEQAKDRAHAIDPANPEVYNREKEAVIHEIHKRVPPA